MKLREVAKRWDWVLVMLAGLVLLFPSMGRVWTLLTVPVVLAVQWWAWGKPFELTPLNPAILLLAVMTGVSVFVTPDVATSLPKVTGVILGMMVFFTVARHSRNRQGWKGSFLLFCLAGMGVAGIGLLGTAWFTTKFTGLNALTNRLPVRVTGLPGAEGGIHPNELAGALVWVVPVVVMGAVALVSAPKWFASQSGRGKVRGEPLSGWWLLLGSAMVICTGVLVLSQSRGGYLATMVTGLVIVVLLAWGRWRWLVVSLVGAGVIGGVVLVNQVGMQAVVDLVVKNLPVGNTGLTLSTLNGRVEIWIRAVQAIHDVPLMGLGMNVFRRAIFVLYPTFKVNASFDLGHAHNEVLQAALDLGLPGLVGFLALYVGAVGMLVRTIRGSGVWRLLALGLLGGLLAHFVYGVTDAVALGAKPGFLFWWLLGLVNGVYVQNRIVKVEQP